MRRVSGATQFTNSFLPLQPPAAGVCFNILAGGGLCYKRVGRSACGAAEGVVDVCFPSSNAQCCLVGGKLCRTGDKGACDVHDNQEQV